MSLRQRVPRGRRVVQAAQPPPGAARPPPDDDDANPPPEPRSGGAVRRGREAMRPTQIPPAGWRDILWRVWNQLGEDNVAVLAGGVAFYAFFALVPALAVLISVYGLVSDPVTVQQQIEALSTVLPEEARKLIAEELHRITSTSQRSLSVGVIVGLLLTLWSAGAGVRGLIAALNTVYDEVETRSYVHLGALSLLFTAIGVVASLLMVALVAAVPALSGALGFEEQARLAIRWLRWPVALALALAALAILYRFGPRRRQARWRWVSWGAVVATLLWLLVSWGLSLYVTYFGSFNKTYGSLGAVAVMLMWIYVGAYAVLLGAEVNAEMEHQTRCDSTVGEPKPLGERGAYVADHVGPVP